MMYDSHPDLVSNLSKGYLIGMYGPEKGKILPLGNTGLYLRNEFQWTQTKKRDIKPLAYLHRMNGAVYVSNPRIEIRVSGDVIKKEKRVACNGTLHVADTLYRLLYLTPKSRTVKRKEQAIRLPTPYSGLLPQGVALSRKLERCLTELIKKAHTQQIKTLWLDMNDEYYLKNYLKDPIGIIQDQNNSLKKITDSQENRRIAKAFLELNAQIESTLFPGSEHKSPTTYDELENVLYIAQNDYMPGHKFILGDESTYNREKLCVDKIGQTKDNDEMEESLAGFLIQARAIGARDDQNVFDKCLHIYFALTERFSLGKTTAVQDPLPNRVARTLLINDCFGQSGVCRHKCTVLQIALQEAGIRSRYLRGKLFFGGYHAWVEADILNDGSYLFILDPHLNYLVLKTGMFESISKKVYLRDEGYPITSKFNAVWRGKRKESQ